MWRTGPWLLDLKFSKMVNTVQKVFFHWQRFPPGITEWSCGSKTAFLLYIVMWWWPWPLTFDLKFSQMVNTVFIHWQKLLPGTCEWSYGSKSEFLPIFGPVVTLTLALWTQNLISSLPYPCQYFQQIWRNSLHAFWSYFANKILDIRTGQTTQKHNASGPLKWAEA